MTTAAKASDCRVDQFFTGAEARFDRWRSLLQAARAWEGAANQQRPEKEKYQAAVSASFAELRQWEDFFAYPGKRQAVLPRFSCDSRSGEVCGQKLTQDRTVV